MRVPATAPHRTSMCCVTVLRTPVPSLASLPPAVSLRSSMFGDYVVLFSALLFAANPHTCALLVHSMDSIYACPELGPAGNTNGGGGGGGISVGTIILITYAHCTSDCCRCDDGDSSVLTCMRIIDPRPPTRFCPPITSIAAVV
jgi:hypothetical protein